MSVNPTAIQEELPGMSIEAKQGYVESLRNEISVLESLLIEERQKLKNDIIKINFGPQTMPYLPGTHFKISQSLRSPDRARVTTMAGFEQFGHVGGALVSQNGVTVLWDAETGLKYDAMNIGKGNSLTAAVSPSGTLMAAGGLSCIVEIYEIGNDYRNKMGIDVPELMLNRPSAESTIINRPSQHCISLTSHSAAVTAMDFADSKQLLSGADNGSLIFWDINKEMPIAQNWLEGAVTSVAASPESKLQAAASDQGPVYLHDPLSRNEHVAKLSVDSEARCMKFTPDGHGVLCSNQKGLSLWDLRTGTVLQNYYYMDSSITGFDISSSGRLAVVGTDSGKLIPIDLIQATWLPHMPDHRLSVSGVSIVKDTVLSSSWDGTMRAYALDCA